MAEDKNTSIETITFTHAGMAGIRVLAKQTKFGLEALKYANHQRSQKKANELRLAGWNAWSRASRPFYVIIGEPERLGGGVQ